MTLSLSGIFRQSGASFFIGIILRHFHFSFRFSLATWFVITVFFFYSQKLSFNKFNKKLLIACFFVLLSFLVGFWRYDNCLNKLNDFAIKEKEEISIEARIIVEPILKNNYQRIIIPYLAIYTEKMPRYHYGDIIQIKGIIQPLENFRSYNSQLVIGSLSYPEIKLISLGKNSIRGIAISFKKKIMQLLQKVMPEPQAGLLISLLFGDKENLADSLEKNIQKTGLSHLIVTSGLHLSILTKILSSLLGILCVGDFFFLVISCFFLLFFSFMVGLTPSIIRAAIMAFLLILSRFSFRLYNSLNALLFTGIAMIWFNPFLLFYDLSFQLSFLATTGILLFYPIWSQARFWQQDVFNNLGGKIIKETAISCFAASILVTPWLIYLFYNFSLIAPLANIILVPFVPLILGGGFIIALTCFIFYPLGLFLGFWFNLLLACFIKIISLFANLPWATILIPFDLRWLIVPYYFLVFWYYYKNN